MSDFMESCVPPVAHIVADLDEIEAEETLRRMLSHPSHSGTGVGTARREGRFTTGWYATSSGILSVAP